MEEKKKIFYFARFLPAHGSTIHIYDLAISMKDKGYDVSICSSGPEDNVASKELFEQNQLSGIKHIYLPFPNKVSFTFLGKIKMVIQYLLFTPYTLWVLLRAKPDILHFHYPVLSFIGRLYKKITGTKYVTTHHITGIPKNFLYQNGDYVIAISKEIKQELVKLHGYKEEQIVFIPNGVSKQKFDGKRGNQTTFFKKYSIQNNAPIIGFVGSINQRKGLDILCKALSQVEYNFNLVIVGDDSESIYLERLIKQYDLSSKTFPFPFQDPYPFYQIFDIFVLPSRAEGFPLVTIEAMLMKVPIIRSNTGGAQEQVIVDKNGYIFENENAKELARYCKKLLKDESLRKQMGEFGREYALAHFTKEHMIAKTIKTYQLSPLKNPSKNAKIP